jgi:hypothetical protein
MMSPSARREYVRRMQALYREAKGRREKGRLLGQVSETLGRSRRQAKRLMRGKEPPSEHPFRHREPVYPEKLVDILKAIWEAAQYPWSVRLKALLPLWLVWIRKRWSLTADEERQLLSMSPATMDRRLAPHKKRLGRRIFGKTKPGRFLRRIIPIQTEAREVPEPGWTEVDTVSHSGPSYEGVFAYTLNMTDLLTQWVEPRAILGKRAELVVAATDEIRMALPFTLKGMDSDNGDEFINWELERYCFKQGVRRFRSREYKKDDQAHIEQKNGTHVRRLMGWDRYDTPEAVAAMNELYRGPWRLLANLFLPSVKLGHKIRIGSRIKRVYEDAKTPLDRLIESKKGDPVKVEELRLLRKRLDPFELAKEVDRKLEAIWKLASRGNIKPAPTPYVPPARPRWHEMVFDDDSPSAIYAPPQPNALKQVFTNCWRDRFFGTN